MKALFALTIGLCAGAFLAQSSFAGPEPIESKTVAPAPQVSDLCNWTGFYIGAHAGYGGGNLEWRDTDTEQDDGPEPEPNLALVDKTQAGLFAGGQLGYNHQFGHFVIGGEGDFSYSEARTRLEQNFQEDEPSVFDTHNDWIGTISLRAGYAAGQHFLLYVIGGAAFVHEDYSNLHHDAGGKGQGGFRETFTSDEVRFGGMVGVGIEYAMTCHWSVKLEYNHLFLGTDDISGTHLDAGVPEPETYSVSMDQDSVQLGLNYKFGSILGAHDASGASYGYTSVARIDPKSSKEVVQPVMEEPCNWTGFYVGLHAGYEFGNLTWQDDGFQPGLIPPDEPGPGEPFVDKSQDGLFAGGQVGYNHQFGSWVIGGEGTIAYSDARTRTDVNFTDTEPSVFDTHNDWTGTFALRAGYALKHFLFFIKGGGAFVSQTYSSLHHDNPEEEFAVAQQLQTGFAETFKSDEVRIGGLVGGGIEYAITCHWSVKLEYNHLFLGTDDITGTHLDAGVPEPERYVVDLDQNTVQAGLNYKF